MAKRTVEANNDLAGTDETVSVEPSDDAGVGKSGGDLLGDAFGTGLGRDASVIPDDETSASSGKPSVADDDGDEGDQFEGGLDDDQEGPATELDFARDQRYDSDDSDDSDDADSGESESDDDSGGSVEDPGTDGAAPIPEQLKGQLDAELDRLRAARPGSGDGATDPSEIESEAAGAAGPLTSHVAQGRALFGQPDLEAQTGGDFNFNAGADSTGAGVTTPSEEQDVANEGPLNDKTLDGDAGFEPFADPADTSADSADSASFLPSEAAGPVDDGIDLPDAVVDPA